MDVTKYVASIFCFAALCLLLYLGYGEKIKQIELFCLFIKKE